MTGRQADRDRIARWAGLALWLVASASLQTTGLRTAAAAVVTPVSYICTMHPDVLEDHPGDCAICRMRLQPVRVERAWSCPLHAAVLDERAGFCRYDRRELVPVTVNHYWACAGDATVFYGDDGRCADGTRRRERREIRAHGDHNPRHGGLFFMASDLWHHLEGIYPSASVFRLFVYDNFMKPLAATGMSGEVVLTDAGGRETGRMTLFPASDAAVLEARLKTGALPQQLTALVRFKPDAPEERFDFTFQAFSVEPAADAGTVSATGTLQRARREMTAAARDTTAPGNAPSALAVRIAPSPAPAGMLAETDDAAGLLAVMKVRVREVRTLIDQGNFASVYAPGMLAKDSALSIAAQAGSSETPRQRRIVAASHRVVVAAWKIDRFGDLGDRERLLQAHAELTAAVTDLETACAVR